jgi:acyl-CoA thioesterase-1
MRNLILAVLLVFPPGRGVDALGKGPEPTATTTARPIMVLGDSLSAAFRIAPESGWVTLLTQRLAQHDPPIRTPVINASISGETTAGGLARLPKLLADNHPGLVLVELGANDGLRGLPLEEIKANLRRILTLCRDAGAKIVLLGIELPLNYGPQYRDGFRSLYRDVAHEFNVPLLPFLLEGVATDPKLMQEDGMHPLAAGEPRVLDNVWPVLSPMLK